MGLQNDHISWNELISQNFYNLTDFEIFPFSGPEYVLMGLSSQNKSSIFFFVLLLPLSILKEIFEGRYRNNDEKSVSDCWLTVGVCQSWYHLQTK